MDLAPLIAISVALGVLAWLAFLWTVRSGQYDDPEGPKYRMLEDDDGPEARAPGAREPGAGEEQGRDAGRRGDDVPGPPGAPERKDGRPPR